MPGAPCCDSSGGERAVVQQIVREVAAFGREPKLIKEPVTETEIAEKKLARKVQNRDLQTSPGDVRDLSW